uniref:Uncharacterized protein n=1 Tax=Globisporangium ultimum (strain ATCC 200006 / CBS 805.95 / DAOM BR144) TaxID=431595 RepID=K3WNM8_GLOUD
MVLSSPRGQLYVEGVSMVRKFVDAHRVVVVTASQLAVLGTDLLFHEYAWATLSDVTVEQNSELCHRPQTLMQTHYQVRCERAASSSSTLSENVRDGRQEYVRGYVQHALGERMRELLLHLQSILVQDFALIDEGATLVLPSELKESAPC